MALSNVQKSFLDSLLNFSEIKKHFQFLFFLMTAKSEKIIAIIDKKLLPSVDPFRYMAYGLAIYTITQFVTPAEDTLGPGATFIYEVIAWVIFIVYLFLYLFITYSVFKKRSSRDRNFDQFLVLSALLSGTTWTLAGIALILMSILPQELNRILLLFIAVYPSIFSVKVYRLFWEMSRAKVVKLLLFSFFLYFLIILGIALLFKG